MEVTILSRIESPANSSLVERVSQLRLIDEFVEMNKPLV